VQPDRVLRQFLPETVHANQQEAPPSQHLLFASVVAL
jgi:hypothetical protein